MDFDVARAQGRRDFEAAMKLAPSTTALRAVFARSTMARLSAKVRSTSTSDGPAPGIDGRAGSAPVARRRRSNPIVSPPASATSRAFGSIPTTFALRRRSMALSA